MRFLLFLVFFFESAVFSNTLIYAYIKVYNHYIVLIDLTLFTIMVYNYER